MYCIKCGEELAAGQQICPICETRVYHPDIPNEEAPTYPRRDFVSEEFNRNGLLFVITVLWLLPTFLPMAFELAWNGEISWSGYVIGALALGYVAVILPWWFKRANPVIFVPCDFAAATAFLWYVDFATEGEWFWYFALPISAGLCLIVTAVIALCRYLSRGRLFVFGGAFAALGLWTQLIELLLRTVLDVDFPVMWSLFSFATLLLVGMMLIVIGIVRPLRDSLKKIFFVG